MPTPSNTPDDGARLSDRFGIKGRLPLQLDETVIPVISLGDVVDDASIPPEFRPLPGERRAMLTATSQDDDTQVSTLRWGPDPASDDSRAAQLERIRAWWLPGQPTPPASQRAAIVLDVTTLPPPGGGVIGTFQGEWMARVRGSPQTTVQLVTPSQPAPTSQRICALPLIAGGDVGWIELPLAIRTHVQGASSISFTPVVYDWSGGTLVRTLAPGAWMLTVQWRE